MNRRKGYFWYLPPLGDLTNPCEVIHGYTMGGIENNIIP